MIARIVHYGCRTTGLVIAVMVMTLFEGSWSIRLVPLGCLLLGYTAGLFRHLARREAKLGREKETRCP